MAFAQRARGDNLYRFWGGTIAQYLNTRLQEQPGEPVLVNLASPGSISKSIDRGVLKARVVECVFEDFRDGTYKIISFFAKRASRPDDAPRHPKTGWSSVGVSRPLPALACGPEASGPDKLVFRRKNRGVNKMINKNPVQTPEQSQLGKATAYPDQYAPQTLFFDARQPQRSELGMTASTAVAFTGADLWTGYELSWLNPRGSHRKWRWCRWRCRAKRRCIVEQIVQLYLSSFSSNRFAQRRRGVRQRITRMWARRCGSLWPQTQQAPGGNRHPRWACVWCCRTIFGTSDAGTRRG